MSNIKSKIKQTNINSSFVAPTKKKGYAYITVDKRFLNLGDRLNFTLYSKNLPSQMSLFLQSDTVLDKDKKQKLEEIENIYVSVTEKSRYEYFIEENLQNILKNETLTMDEKTEVIYTSSTELTHSLYNNPNALENANRSEKIVTPIMESIIYNEDTISSYMKIIEYDYYTHTHSLNVSVYTLCLGAALNLKKDLLTSLGRAALLHDLGKSQIDKDIVNKDGKLTQEEFETMKNHPALGHEIAIHIGIDDQRILDGIRHHHEKLDGMGYPDKIKGDDITLFPRIIGICDVFDALTTRRTYKDAMKTFDALHIMRTEMNTHLDMKILGAFIKMLHK